MLRHYTCGERKGWEATVRMTAMESAQEGEKAPAIHRGSIQKVRYHGRYHLSRAIPRVDSVISVGRAPSASDVCVM